MESVSTDIQVRAEGSSTRYVLPYRPQTAARWIGCVPMVFGLFFSGFAVFWMISASGILEANDVAPAGPEAPGGGAAGGWHWEWTHLLLSLFGLPFFFAGLAPMGMGAALIMKSRGEIVVTEEELIAIERYGPFPVRRRRSIAAVQRLRIAPVSTKSLPLMGLGITVVGEGQADLPMAGRYPRELLAPLARQLAEELTRRKAARLLASGSIVPPAVMVEEAVTNPAAPVADEPARWMPEDIPEQPADSKIVFAATPESLTFMVPRTGFRGVALFFLIFSLFWNGVTFCVLSGFAMAFVAHPSFENLFPLAFLMLFVAIGVGMALAAVQTAFRKAVILATRDTLVYTQTGPVRNAEYQWKREEVAAIRKDYSGTSINDRRLEELQVYDRNGVKRGFFDGRDAAELEWLAATLRALLGVPPRT